MNVRTCNDEKLIIYLGEAASFVKMSDTTAQLIGGLGIKPNQDILEFSNKSFKNTIDWKSLSNPYMNENSSKD